MNAPMTLFERIIARQIPAEIVYEDDEALAFRDIAPKAPVHVLIVPKRSIPRIGAAVEADEKLLGHLLLVAGTIARQLGVSESGFRVVINHGPDAGESIPHLHVHLLAGRALAWPPG
jgi:histidine triad (HIT) family protein